VHPEPNGLPFDPDFESWKLISTTDRGDNNTLRFILGNDIAFNAARSGDISPWPDGTRFAKIAWQQESGSDGLIHPGKFVQVELMIKDAKRYKDTDGWGWGRWRGVDLKPYGNDEHFVNECTGCHRPVRGDDYVYTLPISEANIGRDEVVNNLAAALPATLPYRPLHWRAITMYVDPKTRTTAMLFGDDAAMRAVQARDAAPMGPASNPSYPAGAVLALVTWAQRDDPHWFGARIPAAAQSVEFVEMGGQVSRGAIGSLQTRGLTSIIPQPARSRNERASCWTLLLRSYLEGTFALASEPLLRRPEVGTLGGGGAGVGAGEQVGTATRTSWREPSQEHDL
jgi:hypothetical protein